jgi:RNA polymerase sigma-70 factor (ECF subfamily)
VAAAADRAHWGRVLAATFRAARDLDVAEEATADAFLLALQTWPRTGVPDSVEAWLLTAARRRAIDRIRRAITLRDRMAQLSTTSPLADGAADIAVAGPAVDDDELRLVVLFCHPALTVEAQVALTLRLGCGVPTAAVASAFLVSEATMAARLTRAKRRVASSGSGGDLPDDEAVEARLPAVRRVVQLAYTMGHTAGAGGPLRDDDLAGRAVHLARSLVALRPDDRETAGLLALLLLTEARAPGRLAVDGSQLLLPTADRSTWDHESIENALRLLVKPTRGVAAGPYALQAAIAAEHATAARFDDTDWGRIVELYDSLLTLEPSPTLALGRCVAISYLHGPEAGLADLEEVLALGRLDGYPYAHAARADLLERLGRTHDARRAWVRAGSCARTAAERTYFGMRAAGDPARDA